MVTFCFTLPSLFILFLLSIISLSLCNTKDYCIQEAKPQLDANWPKIPPLFCLLARYLAHIVSCDVTLPNHISYIIDHLIGNLVEKPPPMTKQETFLDWIYLFHAISSNFGSAGRKAPSPNNQTGKKFWTGSIHFIQFPATLDQMAEKPPSFLPF